MLHAPFELIDARTHLLDPIFNGQVRAVLDRAERSGVTSMVCLAGQPDQWPLLYDLAQQHPMILPCFGLSPDAISDRPRDWLNQLGLFLRNIAAGVGPIGLPAREHRNEGRSIFKAQWDLARQFRRPVIIERQQPWRPLVQALDDAPTDMAGLLVHVQGFDAGSVDTLVRHGAYFSLSGDVFKWRKGRLAKILNTLALDRLVLESSSPEGIPPDRMGPYVHIGPEGRMINEPANLPHIFRALAPLLALEQDQLAQALGHNAMCLLGVLMRG